MSSLYSTIQMTLPATTEVIKQGLIAALLFIEPAITDNETSPSIYLTNNTLKQQLRICSNEQREFNRASINADGCELLIAKLQRRIAYQEYLEVANKNDPTSEDNDIKDRITATCDNDYDWLELGEIIGRHSDVSLQNNICFATLEQIDKEGEITFKDLFDTTKDLMSCSLKTGEMDTNYNPIACDNIKMTFEKAMLNNAPEENDLSSFFTHERFNINTLLEGIKTTTFPSLGNN